MLLCKYSTVGDGCLFIIYLILLLIGLFPQVLAVVNEADANTLTVLLGKYLKVKLVSHKYCIYLTLLKPAKQVFKVVSAFYAFITNV